MPTNVVRFQHQGRVSWGVLDQGLITSVPGEFPTTGDFLRTHSAATLKGLTGGDLSLSDVSLLSPVTHNQQFICQGANYRSHMIESGMDPDEKAFNMFFRKASSCIAPAETDVVCPTHVRLLDYEIELGLVLGADIAGPLSVSESNLHEFVAGIVIVNDYSARDVQIPQMQFYKGKSYRTFGPVGPYLCLLEPGEMDCLTDLQLRLEVNGHERQSASTGELIFPPAETLTELSTIQNLNVGDLIATGTPAGCALRVPPKVIQKIGAMLSDKMKFDLFVRGQSRSKRYLKADDEVVASIKSRDGVIDLGTQRNRIVAG